MLRRILLASPLILTLLLSGCAFPPDGPIDGYKVEPFGVSIETRDHWPATIPLRARLHYTGPIYNYTWFQAEAQTTLPGGETLTDWREPLLLLVNYPPGHYDGDQTQLVGMPQIGTESISFAATVNGNDYRDELPDNLDWTIRWQGYGMLRRVKPEVLSSSIIPLSRISCRSVSTWLQCDS